MKIGVINCGVSNVGSVLNMFKRLGASAISAERPQDLSSCDRIVLPGVGAFDSAIRSFRQKEFEPSLRDGIARGLPVLGICLGMHLLGDRSEEGTEVGLSVIPGLIKKFQFAETGPKAPKVPHMGWNTVRAKNSVLLEGMPEPRFYFVHSYYFSPSNPSDVAGVTDYGMEFVSSIQRGKVWGVQFHPEKSHRYGLKLLENFVKAT